MITGSQLAATDFNLGSELSQAKTKSEEKRFIVTCSKVTNDWSGKPIKETKDRSVFKLLVRSVDEVLTNEECFLKPMSPIVSQLTASSEKSCKSTVAAGQQWGFRWFLGYMYVNL